MIGSQDMDELHQARSEIERLERGQGTILERLLHIRMEIKAYRTKIDMLIRESLPSTTFLPNYPCGYSNILSHALKIIWRQCNNLLACHVSGEM